MRRAFIGLEGNRAKRQGEQDWDDLVKSLSSITLDLSKVISVAKAHDFSSSFDYIIFRFFFCLFVCLFFVFCHLLPKDVDLYRQ